MMDLLESPDLPEGFEYPKEFIRVVSLHLTNLEPWWILTGELLQTRHSGLASRYPNETLVPFARRQDNDDVACWRAVRDEWRTVTVHDFTSPVSIRNEFPSFYAWLQQAINDLIEFG